VGGQLGNSQQSKAEAGDPGASSAWRTGAGSSPRWPTAASRRKGGLGPRPAEGIVTEGTLVIAKGLRAGE